MSLKNHYRAYIPVNNSPLLPLRKKSVSPPTTTVQETVVVPPRKSKAIPIVAPPADSIKTAEIKAMLNSFDGKAIHEKKQLLGDQLFPLVKVRSTCPLALNSNINLNLIIGNRSETRTENYHTIIGFN